MAVTERRRQTKVWTKELTWSEVARAAKLLANVGLIDRIPESRLRRALKDSRGTSIKDRKLGKADSATRFIRTRRKQPK